MIQIKFLYFTCLNDKSALAYFGYRAGGSRNILNGAATNEIFGRINSSTCFCGVGSVCVCSSLLTRKETATLYVSLSNSLITSTIITSIPFEFQGQGLDVKVAAYKYGNYLLSTIEIKLLSSS